MVIYLVMSNEFLQKKHITEKNSRNFLIFFFGKIVYPPLRLLSSYDWRIAEFMSKKDQKKQRHGSRPPSSNPKKSGRPSSSREVGSKSAAPHHARSGSAHRSSNPVRSRPGERASGHNDLWLFGHHAVLAALHNQNRIIRRLLLTKRSLEQYREELQKIIESKPNLTAEIVTIDILENQLPDNCVHQGIALLTKPLPPVDIKECCGITSNESHLVLILDQVTDPHNVGAIMRSATAFGARAIISPERHSPPESGTLAKSASGALEILPWIRVTNLSRTLDELAEMGYWRLGLDGTAEMSIKEADFGRHIALVMGAEGKGLRKGTQSHCDALIKLPIKRTMESLNVSNAAAIALYEFSTL